MAQSRRQQSYGNNHKTREVQCSLTAPAAWQAYSSVGWVRGLWWSVCFYHDSWHFHYILLQYLQYHYPYYAVSTLTIMEYLHRQEVS